MDQVYIVRHKVLVEGRAVRRVAREMGISRNTVRRYVDGDAKAGVRIQVDRPRPVSDRVRPRPNDNVGVSCGIRSNGHPSRRY